MKKFLPRTINNPQGFTLIELMVVVSIIAFLAVIGVAAFSNAQKQARDARRRADIEAIAAALESNRDSVNNKYKPNGTSLITIVDNTNDTNSQTLDGLFSSGVRPKDPTSTGTYIYTTTIAANGVSFTVCADLENDGGNSTNATFGGTGTAYYCIKSRQ